MAPSPHELHDLSQYRMDRINSLDDFPKVEGFHLDKGLTLDQFIGRFASNGFQATQLGRAIEVLRAMLRERATIFLAFTSNQITGGNRDIITYLVKHRLVSAIVTTAGGIEEDVMKCFKPFVIGDFEVSGRSLFERGISRTGNIFVPNDRYLYFEKFMNVFLEEQYGEQKKAGRPMTVKSLLTKLGEKIDDESSYLYWAHKNTVPVFCPALTDGSFGDMLYFFKHRRPDFTLDITQDMKDIVDLALNAEKTGCLIIGGGVAKHHVLNANIYREGCDYLALINTGEEFDGSDSGARIEESISWGKVKTNGFFAKVHCDASIALPLIVAGALAPEKDDDTQERDKGAKVEETKRNTGLP